MRLESAMRGDFTRGGTTRGGSWAGGSPTPASQQPRLLRHPRELDTGRLSPPVTGTVSAWLRTVNCIPGVRGDTGNSVTAARARITFPPGRALWVVPQM